MICHEDDRCIEKIKCIVWELLLKSEMSDNICDTSFLNKISHRYFVIRQFLSSFVRNRRGHDCCTTVIDDSYLALYILCILGIFRNFSNSLIYLSYTLSKCIKTVWDMCTCLFEVIVFVCCFFMIGVCLCTCMSKLYFRSNLFC